MLLRFLGTYAGMGQQNYGFRAIELDADRC